MERCAKIPDITLVIPAHNVEPWIEQAVSSIQHQTFANFGLVVVNDRSSDATGEIARQVSKEDSRVHVIDTDYADLNLARYQGLAHAQEWWGISPLVAFPDGDDVRDARFLECCLEPFSDPTVQVVYTGLKRISSEGEEIKNWLFASTRKGRIGLDDLLLGDFPAATTAQ